nr:rhomboid family intramembrane serine protease [Streptomyces sp. TP-A0874]
MIRKVRSATAAVRRAARSDAPLVTWFLIGLCCLVFLLSPVSGFAVTDRHGDGAVAEQLRYFRHWGVIPRDLIGGKPRALLTLLTALFVHGSWLHLIGNMLFLYVFGGMVETRMGRVRFTLFYLCCGVLALLAFALANPTDPQTLVGASGAVAGLLGAFLYHFPRARITSLFPFLFFLPLRFPAWVVLPFWLTLQWLATRTTVEGPAVAYLAHLAGFGLGFCYTWAHYGRGTRVSGVARATEGESQP